MKIEVKRNGEKFELLFEFDDLVPKARIVLNEDEADSLIKQLTHPGCLNEVEFKKLLERRITDLERKVSGKQFNVPPEKVKPCPFCDAGVLSDGDWEGNHPTKAKCRTSVCPAGKDWVPLSVWNRRV